MAAACEMREDPVDSEMAGEVMVAGLGSGGLRDKKRRSV